MEKRILFGCYEIPGYGGAATATYQLFRRMQEDNFDVHYLNLIDEQDAAYFAYAFGPRYGNPLSLDHVYNCVLEAPLYSPHSELSELIKDISPDLMIGVDFIAALLMKRASPKTILIFMTAGCQQIKDAVTGRIVTDLISHQEQIAQKIAQPTRLPRRPCRQEVEAADTSDFILTHSDVTLSLFQYFYPYISGKIHPRPIWFAEWIYGEALKYAGYCGPFFERDIDVLFVSSSWARPEKNYTLVKRLIGKLGQATIHLLGEIEDENKLPGAHYHGLLTGRDQLFTLMGRTRTVVSPSLYDSAPGILFEAAAMGCNIVTSKNCGNWMICNEQLLVDPYSEDRFLKNIALSLSRKFDDNIKLFLDTESYRQLVDIIHLI
jgi:glycosyltransferase involved in cell wall biosynthesis